MFEIRKWLGLFFIKCILRYIYANKVSNWEAYILLKEWMLQKNWTKNEHQIWKYVWDEKDIVTFLERKKNKKLKQSNFISSVIGVLSQWHTATVYRSCGENIHTPNRIYFSYKSLRCIVIVLHAIDRKEHVLGRNKCINQEILHWNLLYTKWKWILCCSFLLFFFFFFFFISISFLRFINVNFIILFIYIAPYGWDGAQAFIFLLQAHNLSSFDRAPFKVLSHITDLFLHLVCVAHKWPKYLKIVGSRNQSETIDVKIDIVFVIFFFFSFFKILYQVK